MASEKEIFIIDSHAYLYKNYFALPKMLTSKGEEAGAVYGFLRMLLKIIKEKKPLYLAVCYDSPGPTKRKEKYQLYKANRPETDRALIDQINLSAEILRDLGIKTVSISGFEADDIIASITQKALKNGLKPVIVSPDKDICSLISLGAYVWDGSAEEYFSEEYVLKKFMVPSSLVEDFLSLTGDGSDNIPGAEGIGPKKAAQLLEKYGSLDSIISACQKDGIEDKNLLKVKESLDSVRLSKELVKLDFTAPVGEDLEIFSFGGLRTEKIPFWAQRLEFGYLYELDKKDELFSFGNENIIESAPSLPLTHILDSNPGEISVFENKLFTEAGYCEFDQCRDIAPLLKSGARKYLYDTKEFLKNCGIFQMENFEDIRLAYYLAYGGQRKPDPYRMVRELYPAQANSPAAAAKKVFFSLEKILDEKNLKGIYEGIEKPLVSCLAEMERNGMSVDEKRLRDLNVSLEKEIENVLLEFRSAAQCDINLNSPKQVSSFIYEKLNLPLTEKQKSMFKTKTGYTTSEEALVALEPYSPLISLIIKYRELAKLKSSFVEVLLEKISDGRIHTVFDQTGTATGRLSSSNPNLQNIPVKTSHAAKIRACFNAPSGFLLVSADYSQIDLRVLAHESGDEKLVEAFRRGDDIHLKTAMQIFAKTPGEITADMRRIAKTVNFGIIYGQSPNGLSRELSIPQSEAAGYIESYFNYYSGVKAWSLKVVEESRKRGYCINFAGRRRELAELNSSNRAVRAFAERIALNMPIQSGSSDIIKKAMISIMALIRDNPEIKLCSQVHDELIFEIREDKIDKWAPLIKKEMENSYSLSVPLLVEIKAGPNWAEMKKINSGV